MTFYDVGTKYGILLSDVDDILLKKDQVFEV